MSELAKLDLSGAEVVALPIRAKPAEPHKYGSKTRIGADEAGDGLERFEKCCAACQLVRITVIPPSWSKAPAWREYRWPDDATSFLADIEPECPGAPAFKSEAAE